MECGNGFLLIGSRIDCYRQDFIETIFACHENVPARKSALA